MSETAKVIVNAGLMPSKANLEDLARALVRPALGSPSVLRPTTRPIHVERPAPTQPIVTR